MKQKIVQQVMPSKLKRLGLAIVVALGFCLFSSPSFSLVSRNLTVFAEPNMVLALTKIAREFSRQTNSVVSINFNLSQDLMTDVDSGEPMDVLISAHSELIDSLKQKGVVDVHSLSYIASDSLVLVTSSANSSLDVALKKASSLEDGLAILNQSSASLLVDYNGNSAGKFGTDFLRDKFLPNLKIFSKVSDDKSPILSFMRSNKDIYGLLLASQVKKGDKNFVILLSDDSLNIFYQALVIAGDNMETAREFVKFLKSDIAKSILKDSGFKTLVE